MPCHQPPSQRWWHGGPKTLHCLRPHLWQHVPALQNGLGLYLPILCQQPTCCPSPMPSGRRGPLCPSAGHGKVQGPHPASVAGGSQPLGQHWALPWHHQHSLSTCLWQEKPGGALKIVTVFLLCFCQPLKVIFFQCTSITGTTSELRGKEQAVTGAARRWGDLGQELTSPPQRGWDQSPAPCLAHRAAHTALQPLPLPQGGLWGTREVVASSCHLSPCLFLTALPSCPDMIPPRKASPSALPVPISLVPPL